jgi:hypothetical protein
MADYNKMNNIWQCLSSSSWYNFYVRIEVWNKLDISVKECLTLQYFEKKKK